MGHRGIAGTDGERGVSLLELMIYLTVMAILGVPLAMVTVSVSRSSAEGDMLSKILERNRAALHRISSEYRESLNGTTVIGAGGKSLQFTSNGGFDGTGPVAGPIIVYDIRLAPGETGNGTDDNNNGLIDEGSLVRVNQGTNEQIVLTNALNTTLSSFVANGGGVTINLTTSGKTHHSNLVTEAQRAVTVFPRN